MHSAILASVLSYHALFLIYAQVHAPARGGKATLHVLALAALSAVCAFVQMYAAPLLGIPLTVAVMAAALLWPVGLGLAQALFAAGWCVLNLYLFFCLFSAAEPLMTALYPAAPRTLTALLSVPCALAFLTLLRKTIFPDRKMGHFFGNAGEIRRAAAYAMAATAALTALHAQRPSWEVWALMAVYGALLVLINRALERMRLAEYRWRLRLLEEQCLRQQRQDKAWQSRIRSIQAFEHDLKPMMGVLKGLIEADDHARALRLIQDLYGDLQNRAPDDGTYSNDAILDALLREVAATCREKGIRFCARLSLPEDTGLSALDAIRLVSNITGNAVRACLTLPADERFMAISCHYERHWVTLEAVNSYDGVLREEDGRLLTTKAEQADGGMGLSILGEIAEKLGGFWFYDADTKEKTFLIRVHVPREAPKHTAGGQRVS